MGTGTIFVLPNEERAFSLVSKTYTQRGGFNTEVTMMRYEEDGTRKVEKRIGAKRDGFSVEEAAQIVRDIANYQRALENIGVPMPAMDPGGFSIRYDPEADKALVYATSAWAGFDVEYLIRIACARNGAQSNDLLAGIVHDMAAILRRVCDVRFINDMGTETILGIDPKPSNFTLDENGKMWYVDSFPPRYRKDGEPIIEWHPLHTSLGKELGYFKYYDVRGIFLGLTAQLARISPLHKVFFENICLQEFEEVLEPSVWKEFEWELSCAPWRILRGALDVSPEKDPEILEECADLIHYCFTRKLFGINYHVYTLREFALELACAGLMTTEEMEEFFRESHFEEELPSSQLRHLKDELYSFLMTRAAR